MVRVYRRKLGSRRYADYSADILQAALNQIRTKKISLRRASKKYKIPLGTLSHKLRGKFKNSVGHPLALTADEELLIVQHAECVAAWGFPLDLTDMRKLIKQYLSKKGKNVPQFKDNYPSTDWARNFLKRHKNNLTLRMCQNIKRNRAAVSADIVQQYFANLESTIKDIPPTHVFNYDETNLSDNPGFKKCIFKRGVKYPERVRDFSKSAISIMFCGNANGNMLPAYVVYKSEHLWSTWMEGGPAKTRYGRTKSGWFDACAFEDWFESIFIPAAKNLPGIKVIIGDNLSSHFTETVLKLCEENNIRFCCLPPNSTHLLQPLDVSFYAPLKRYWRHILDNWKLTSRHKSKTLTKEEFPKLLFQLYNKLYEGEEKSENMISGFDKCGIYPFNPERALSRLPDYQPNEDQEDSEAVVSECIIDLLRDLRGVKNEPVIKIKKKKINVEAGRSICPSDLNTFDITEPEEMNNEEANETEEKSDQESESNIEEESYEEHIPLLCEKFYLVKFQVKNLIKHYVAKLISIEDVENTNAVEMAFLRMSRKINFKFHWPQVSDKGEIPRSELVKLLSDPTEDRRNALIFKNNELKRYLNTLQ